MYKRVERFSEIGVKEKHDLLWSQVSAPARRRPKVLPFTPPTVTPFHSCALFRLFRQPCFVDAHADEGSRCAMNLTDEMNRRFRFGAIGKGDESGKGNAKSGTG